ncbi:MAG TPA: hypothetical protein VK194_00320 [Candidatus Deferrimicrobium sp.]|nr:hypothetical protein [Candidatus Deferrimicrobium sp.]
MQNPRRLRLPEAPPVAISTGPPLRGSQRWTTPIRGYAAHAGRIHVPSGSLLLSDGWGVSVASLRFRRHALSTGEELASIRTGTAARCFAVLPDDTELIAATDSKLFRLGIARLDERERWERRVPRYSNSIAVRGSCAVVANWKDPRVSIIDLATGRVRRRDAPEMMLVVDGPADPLLVSGTRGGGTATIDPASGRLSAIRETPPAIDAVMDPDALSLWSTVGVRGTWSRTSVVPGSPTQTLRRDWLDDREPARQFVLPVGVGRIAIGRSEMWLASKTDLVALPMPVGVGPARVWHSPADHKIEWFDPDERVAIVVKRIVRENAAMATAFDLT